MYKITTLYLLAIAAAVMCTYMANAQELDWIVEVPKNPNLQIQRVTFMESDASNNLYVVEIQTFSSPGGTSGVGKVRKFSPSGAILWTIDAPSAINPVAYFDVAPDGSFYITGNNNFPVATGFVNKYDAGGNLLWSQTFLQALMGRAVPLASGDVLVEGRDPAGPFSVILNSAGVQQSRIALANVVVSTDILNPVAASHNNAQSRHCGLISTPSAPGFAFALLDSNGNALYSLPVNGILFPADLRDVEIDDSGNCIYSGQTSGSRLQIGSTQLPADEIRNNFLARVSPTGVVDFIRVYDLRVVDDVECRGPGFTRCWLSGSDLVGSPTLARLDTNFNIVDLFHGPDDSTRSFKIEFAPNGRLDGAFTIGVASGTWFGSPIVVPEDPNSFFEGSMFVFQINLGASRCTTQCPPNNACCRLNNQQNACYDRNIFNCFTDDGLLCAIGNVACGNACFNPNQLTCIGDFLCPLNHLRCGNACYRPSVHTCFDGQLCPVGTNRCGDVCYSPSQYSCCSGELCPVV